MKCLLNILKLRKKVIELFGKCLIKFKTCTVHDFLFINPLMPNFFIFVFTYIVTYLCMLFMNVPKIFKKQF